jgi:hypothetical protein
MVSLTRNAAGDAPDYDCEVRLGQAKSHIAEREPPAERVNE